jgi:hypothetical protein
VIVPQRDERKNLPPSQNIVTDLRSRDRYMIAFNNAASGLDDATAVKTVSTKDCLR